MRELLKTWTLNLKVESSPRNFALGVFGSITIAMTLLIGILTPPFQSPDEMAHFTKGTMLASGQILPEKLASGKSVGYIDSGVVEYMQLFSEIPFHPEKKLESGVLVKSREIKFSGTQVMSETVGLSTYFPGLYLPEASVIAVGKALGWTVDSTYRLAKAAATLFYLVLLFLSFLRLKKIEPIFLAFLALPMSLFQIASPTLDGPTIVLAVLASQILLDLPEDAEKSKRRITIAFAMLLLIALTRPYLIIVLALPIVFNKAKELKNYLIGMTLAGLALVAVWYAVSAHTYDKTFQINPEPGQTILHFVSNPLEFLQIVYATFADPIMRTFIATSFIGNLGWLDTPFSLMQYMVLGLTLLSVIVVSVLGVRLRIRRNSWLTLAVFIVSVISVLGSMLATWTPQPSAIIEGVQGRYLLVPAVIFGLFISSLTRDKYQAFARSLSWTLVFFSLSAGTVFSLVHLVERYYMA
jgi:uncharacterized membrane protein